MADIAKKNREPLMHIVKRDDITGLKAWAIRIGAILLGLLLTGIISQPLPINPLEASMR